MGFPGTYAMPTRNPAKPLPQSRPEDRATILFAQLDVAQALGDFTKAAEAQRELECLGWIVTRRRPRHEPARQGVAR